MSDQILPNEEEGVAVVDSTDIPKIRELLNRSVAQMTKAVLAIDKHDAADVMERAQNPAWTVEMKRHLRHFQSSKATVEYGAWMLGQAQQEKSEKAATKLAGRLNLISAVMAAAVIVQAVMAWLTWRGTPVSL